MVKRHRPTFHLSGHTDDSQAHGKVFSIISCQRNADWNSNGVRHTCTKRATLKASSAESGSDAEKLNHPHTDGKTITPENGLAATHAIYHVTRIYTSRQLSQKNETIVSKTQTLRESVYSSSSHNSPKLETTLIDVLVNG